MYLWITVVVVAAYALYKYMLKDADYFEKIGLKYIKPYSNITDMFFKETSLGDVINNMYKKFPTEK